MLYATENDLNDSDMSDTNSSSGSSSSSSSSSSQCYKKCGDYIVTMKKLPDTITNESRRNVVDPLYAKFRADKLMVVSIEHKDTGEKPAEAPKATEAPAPKAEEPKAETSEPVAPKVEEPKVETPEPVAPEVEEPKSEEPPKEEG